LAHCAKLGEDFGYDEINLNVGCPSDRVKSGAFGACLMLKPELVADCVLAMATAVKVPVTVKCRIGVDDQDSYAALHHFVSTVAAAGCGEFIVHARKAWLTGLSPKENREVPPLQYELVQKIKQDFPQLRIIVNGGLKTVAEIDQQIQTLDGAMIGREAYHNPYFLTELESRYFGMQAVPSRVGVIEALVPYIERQLRDEGKLTHITRHVLGLFKGQQGANGWRRYLSEHAHLDGAGVEVIMAALEHTGARMSLRCRLKYGLQVWQRSIVRLTRR
jgi:tRNA-dihydrouridine synthase A